MLRKLGPLDFGPEGRRFRAHSTQMVCGSSYELDDFRICLSTRAAD